MILLTDLTTEIPVLASTATLIATVGLIVYKIRRNGWIPFKEKYITARKVRNRKLDELLKTTDEIKKELTINGGSSIKDQINQLQRVVERQTARAKHMDENSHIAIFELDQDGDLTFANAAFRQLVHADDAELAYNGYVSRLHGEDKTRFLRERREAIDNQMPIDTVVRFRTRGNSYEEIALKANPDIRNDILLGFWGTGAKPGCDPSTVPFNCPLAKKD